MLETLSGVEVEVEGEVEGEGGRTPWLPSSQTALVSSLNVSAHTPRKRRSPVPTPPPPPRPTHSWST